LDEHVYVSVGQLKLRPKQCVVGRVGATVVGASVKAVRAVSRTLASVETAPLSDDAWRLAGDLNMLTAVNQQYGYNSNPSTLFTADNADKRP